MVEGRGGRREGRGVGDGGRNGEGRGEYASLALGGMDATAQNTVNSKRVGLQ